MLQLSIIIPCFNCGATLKEAVESCYIQGFTEDAFEIVLVDDGSTDNTKTVIDALTKAHRNIHAYSHESNQGGGATRNTAVSHAHADIIFCLDSDDILPEGTMKKMFDFLKTRDCDAVTIQHSKKFRGVHNEEIHHTDTFVLYDAPITLEDLLEPEGKLCGLYSTFMHTKASFEKSGGYPTTHGFDTQGFAWRYVAAGNKALTCPDAAYLHRIDFHESYFLREAVAGKENYNWQDIFFENFRFFTPETQAFIRNYDCKNFYHRLLSDLKLQKNIFIDNYKDLYSPFDPLVAGAVRPSKRIFIRKNSLRGILLRIYERIKKNFVTR